MVLISHLSRERELEDLKFKIMVKLANLLAVDSNSRNSLTKDINDLFKTYTEISAPVIKKDRKDFETEAKDMLKKFDPSKLNIKFNQF